MGKIGERGRGGGGVTPSVIYEVGEALYLGEIR